IYDIPCRHGSLWSGDLDVQHGQLVAGGADGAAVLCDLSQGKITQNLGGEHAGVITAVHFNSEGTKLVTAGADGKVNIWNAATGKIEYRLGARPNAPTAGESESPLADNREASIVAAEFST